MSGADFAILTVALGIATFAIRFSFLGLFGDRVLPGWVTAGLRFAPVSVLPALVAPQVFLVDGAIEVDLARWGAIAATIAAGIYWRNFAVAFLVGLAALLALSL